MKKCKNCSKDFDPNSGKQKFCSDKCKVYFSRKKIKTLPPEKPEEKSDKETKPFSEGGTILDQINLDNKKLAWVKEVEDFCNEQGILPSDLIESYKEKKAAKVNSGFRDLNKERLGEKAYSPYQENPRYKIVNGKKIFN